jgi:hypothetical protein
MNKNTVARTSIGTPIYSLLPLVSSVAPRLRSRNLTLSARAATEGRGRMRGCAASGRHRVCINLQPRAGVYLRSCLDFHCTGLHQHRSRLSEHCTQPRLQCFVDVWNRPVGERLRPLRLRFLGVRVPLLRQRWGSHGFAIGALERVPLCMSSEVS